MLNIYFFTQNFMPFDNVKNEVCLVLEGVTRIRRPGVNDLLNKNIVKNLWINYRKT